MASTPLTLVLDGEEIDPLSVSTAIRAFIQLLGEIDREIAPGTGRSARFRLTSLSYNSPATIGIAVEPIDDSAPDVGPQIAEACVDGLRLLEFDKVRPESFSDDALEYVVNLGGVMSDGVRAVSVEWPDEGTSAVLSPQTTEYVGEVLAQGYSIGGIEGQLDTISVHGQPSFTLYDSVSGRAVRCIFRPELRTQVKAALGSKVFVHGSLRRDPLGRPSQIREIDQFIRLGRATRPVPSPNMAGILHGIEGNTREYLAWIRGESD